MEDSLPVLIGVFESVPDTLRVCSRFHLSSRYSGVSVCETILAGFSTLSGSRGHAAENTAINSDYSGNRRNYWLFWKRARSGEPERDFSTEGNDSELIRSPASSLTVTAKELPGSGWDQDASNANQRRAQQRFSRGISGGHTEGVLLHIQKEADVSAAKERYALISPEHLTGQAVGVNDTRELEIGVESVFYSWYDENAGEPRNLMKIRDANVLSRLQWTVIGAEEEPVREDPVTIQQIGSLGIAVHRKWRSHRDLSDR